MKHGIACGVAALMLLLLAPGASAQEVITGSDRITLNFENVEITAVLRILSEARRMNIIAGPEVSGPVTVNLYDVTFEDALDAVLGVAGFTHYTIGNIVYVTTEERKAELPPGAHDLEVRSFELDFVQGPDLILAVTEFLSPSGQVIMGSRKTMIVKDSPGYLEIISDLVAELDQPPRQVLISTIIINVERDDNMDIGVGFDSFPLAEYGIEAATGGFSTPFPPRPDALGQFPDVNLGGTGLFAGSLQSDGRAFVNLLDTTSDVDILASPQIRVVDGELARIQVGDRLGFRVTTTTETSTLESVEFLDVGTVLEVTPEISRDGLVRMLINPKVSNGRIDDGLPSENTTELETDLIVQDGETIVIGGLLNATRQRIRSQIPLLGDIPILGRLFGKTTWIDEESEVMVLLTPHIVGPVTSPRMESKRDAGEQWWEGTVEDGLIKHEEQKVKPSPPKRWRNLHRQGGFIEVDGADLVPESAQE